ncbi:HPr family phosphocarrier protein [bacterium 1XD42-8]|jgi:phosphotransferase system HPr (HPr) family protein|nr:HPr family phosphocarrier protein [Lachnospiraceae bacterium]RKJ42604.1 HPr family phosphocarrier protein [bacterium 1XD42-8]
MMEKSITIKLENGLEARPVALLVQVASQYDSTIYLQCADKKVNAKSIMGMMTLGLCSGDKVTAIVEGIDEQAAMEDIEKYLSSQSE